MTSNKTSAHTATPITNLSPAWIRSISPYVPGKPITELAREMGLPVSSITKLASNENPLGMSPKARAAVEKAISGIERYPDTFDLVAALASHLGVKREQIVLGNGSNDVLDLAARVFLTSGRSAVLAQHAFAIYALATVSTGAECIVVPAVDYGHDLEAMKAAIRPDTRVVWIANPNNPTGTFLPYSEVKVFLRSIPSDVVVVLDEAYNEYLPKALGVDTVRWVDEFPNLIVTRTFSKVYGLAGLRVGFAIAAPEVADLMNRVRQPFNVNNLAAAAAVAAIDDKVFLDQSHDLNLRGMKQIEQGLNALGLEWIPSFGNFITFRAENAAAINQNLLKQGVIVRPLGGYEMPQYLRVTIGLEQENDRFLQALRKALQ
jgi:histidinol-phosphate aminotransferase